jgi:hypothetical protein
MEMAIKGHRWWIGGWTGFKIFNYENFGDIHFNRQEF